MLGKLPKAPTGFTLVEVMIVVAIIALLATVAMPNFIRARKRAQASTIIEEMRLIDAAKDTYAVESNKQGGDGVHWPDLVPYFKPGSRLATIESAIDIIGNPIAPNTVDEPPTISKETYDEFDAVLGPNALSFWGSFAPKN